MRFASSSRHEPRPDGAAPQCEHRSARTFAALLATGHQRPTGGAAGAANAHERIAMRTRSKLLRVTLAALATAAMLTIAVGTADATRLEFPNWERGFRIVWNPLTLSAGSTIIRCPVTLEGTFTTRSIVKIPGQRVAAVTAAASNGCPGVNFTLLTTSLPWSMTYNSFTGTLPRIETVKLNLIGMAFQLETSGISCLATTRTERPFRGIATVNSGEIRTFTAEEGSSIETSGGFFCGFSGPASFSGTGTASVRGGTEAIQIRLGIAPQLSPSPVSFGTVEPSSTTERTVTIGAGTAGLTVNSISMTTGTSYSISDPNSCRGARLAANGTCAFIVTFRAPAELARTASDTINVETSAGRLTDNVSGSTPNLIATPSPVEFGRLPTNTLARREVTITAGVEATIESIRMRSGTRFSITDPNRCVGTRLAANGRCTFNVIVETPAEAERTLEDTVLIGTSAGSIEDRVRAST